MPRYKMIVEYDGTRYRGWQVQKEQKTIQGVLISTAYEVFNTKKIELQGSGRTDAGVHALAQVVHLDMPGTLRCDNIRFKFNDNLPYDINVLKVEDTSPKFHARYDAVKRRYVYRISKKRTAFGKSYCWWIKDELNFELMKNAAKVFVGMHDFSSFSDKDFEAEDGKNASTRALIYDMELVDTDDNILIGITASHFLWKMVRRMVGTLVEVGREFLTKEDLERFLLEKTNAPAEFTAPPSGLFLEKVLYKGDKEPVDIKTLKIV